MSTPRQDWLTMRSDLIKPVQHQDRSQRNTNNNRNTELASNKNPLSLNGESLYGHVISGIVATQTPITTVSTFGNEFAGYELNYDNSANSKYNDIFEAANLTNLHSYPNKFEITEFNQEKTNNQLSINAVLQKNIPNQFQNIEIGNYFSPNELDNIVTALTPNTVKNTASEAYFLTIRNLSITESVNTNNKSFHTSNFNSISKQSSTTILQTNEQNDHKNGFLLSPVKQQTTPAFFLLNLGSTLPELTNNFTSFTKLTESVKNINTDSKYTSELSDTLMSSLLSRLSAKNIPNIENVIYTGSKNAVLTGNDFSNVLIGSTGNDILSGGKGDDKLIGGDGNDYFIFSVNDGNDQILDFNVGDRILFKGSINLSELTLNEDASGQILSFNGTTINLIGISDLTISTDWIGFIK